MRLGEAASRQLGFGLRHRPSLQRLQAPHQVDGLHPRQSLRSLTPARPVIRRNRRPVEKPQGPGPRQIRPLGVAGPAGRTLRDRHEIVRLQDGTQRLPEWAGRAATVQASRLGRREFGEAWSAGPIGGNAGRRKRVDGQPAAGERRNPLKRGTGFRPPIAGSPQSRSRIAQTVRTAPLGQQGSFRSRRPKHLLAARDHLRGLDHLVVQRPQPEDLRCQLGGVLPGGRAEPCDPIGQGLGQDGQLGRILSGTKRPPTLQLLVHHPFPGRGDALSLGAEGIDEHRNPRLPQPGHALQEHGGPLVGDGLEPASPVGREKPGVLAPPRHRQNDQPGRDAQHQPQCPSSLHASVPRTCCEMRPDPGSRRRH